MLKRLLAALACLALAPLPASPAVAQAEMQDGPKSLVIQYRTTVAHRAGFRQYLIASLAPKLRAMQRRGELADFRIFYSWYRQPAVWDGMVVLRFPTFAAVARWNEVERTSPGGLDPAGQALGEPIATYSTDLSWAHNADDLHPGQVYYVIPYEYRDATEYRDFVNGYVIPQFEGWMNAGALNGYELYLNRYSTGAPWDALFIQHYRSLAAFGQRAALTESTRVPLRNNPVWKAWGDRKANIRSEAENSIAELIAH